MFIEKQKLQQDLTTESTKMSGTTKQTKVVTINQLFELDREEMSSFSIQLCGKVVSGIDGKLSTLNYISTYSNYIIIQCKTKKIRQ